MNGIKMKKTKSSQDRKGVMPKFSRPQSKPSAAAGHQIDDGEHEVVEVFEPVVAANVAGEVRHPRSPTAGDSVALESDHSAAADEESARHASHSSDEPISRVNAGDNYEKGQEDKSAAKETKTSSTETMKSGDATAAATTAETPNEPPAGSETATPAATAAPSNVKLYKSSRLKGYITLALASFINFDAAQKSDNMLSFSTVPSTGPQRRYAVAVSLVSLILAAAAALAHLDGVTPLHRLWIAMFQPKSRAELSLALFLVVWWSIAVGVETSVGGIAGDGKGQYSLYYSAWTCCLASYWVLERWWVSAGWSSLKSFVCSWPNRAPGWLCIMFLSMFTLIWYIDLWKNHGSLDREAEAGVAAYFSRIRESQWKGLVSAAVLTFVPALMFVAVELFRETNEDGSNVAKGKVENFIEGICLVTMAVSWIPTVMIATTPGGAASLIGNAYFFTWLLVIFVFECFVWYIHDLRKELHQKLKEKHEEYKARQQQVLEQALELNRNRAMSDASVSDPKSRERTHSDYYDAVESQ